MEAGVRQNRIEFPTAVASRRRAERGYNLVETMIAAALLAGVLLAVVTLFVLGGERIRSGKEMTKATATGMDLMEEIRRFPRESSYKTVNGACGANCAGDKTKTWKSNTDDPASMSFAAENNCPTTLKSGGTAANCDYICDYRATLCRWKKDVQDLFRSGPTGTGPSTGITEVKVDGFKNVPSGSAENGDTCFCDAKFLRVRVTVRWKEVRNRQRRVTFETLKF